MRALAGAALLFLVAGCGEGEQDTNANVTTGPDGTATPTAPRPTPIAATQSARPGAVSSTLSGEVSALTGSRSGFDVAVTDTATIVSLAADTLFAFDRADLSSGAIDNLTKTADAVRRGGKGAITITGYTDARGEDAYNLALSQRRAEAVAGWLRAQPGLASRTFDVVGKGEADPVAPNTRTDGSDNPEGRARNRRVEVVIPKEA